jgi:hypothetical protein
VSNALRPEKDRRGTTATEEAKNNHERVTQTNHDRMQLADPLLSLYTRLIDNEERTSTSCRLSFLLALSERNKLKGDHSYG